MQSTQSEPWTIEEVAQFLRVHPKTVRKLGVPGGVPMPTEPGARPIVRYDAETVRAWWAGRVAAARSNAPQPDIPRARASRPVTGRRVLERAVRVAVG
jgi:hypothetical protein